MTRRPLLEIAANSVASALAAQAGGADRIELCGSLAEGGITPSYGSLAMAREQLRIPLYVLIRPRGGDFLYDHAELDVMCRDIETCVRLGCDGVVIGAVDPSGVVDQATCRTLVAAAGTLGVTFHRAFDVVSDQVRALEDVIALGCERVLTSGAQATALQGAEPIAGLVRQAAGRIGVMAGAGVRPDHLDVLLRRTNVAEVHASASRMLRSTMAASSPALPGLEADYLQTQTHAVAALATVLLAQSAKE